MTTDYTYFEKARLQARLLHAETHELNFHYESYKMAHPKCNSKTALEYARKIVKERTAKDRLRLNQIREQEILKYSSCN